MTIRFFVFVFLFVAWGENAWTQFSIGTWRDHLPYQKCIDVCEAGDLVYTATPYALFTFDRRDDAINRISKANGLSDVGITALEYDPTTQWVIVGYQNGNVDLLADGRSVNIPDIKFSSVIGDKAVYDILPFNGKAYLSTGFGVVVIDLSRQEIKETYFIGNNGGPVKVNDIAIWSDTLFAATENGLQKASLSNTFLANFENWTPVLNTPGDTTIQEIEFYAGYMVAAVPGVNEDILWKRPVGSDVWEIQAQLPGFRINELWCNGEWLTTSGSYGYLVNHFDFGYTHQKTLLNGRQLHTYNTVIGQFGMAWAADKFNGLMWSENFEGTADRIIVPIGPASASCRRIETYNKRVWIAHGGVRPDWGNIWNTDGWSGFLNDDWTMISSDTNAFAGNHFNPVNGYISDMMSMAIDPKNNERVIGGSWEEGLLELNVNTREVRTLNGTASTGPNGSGFDWAPGWTGVAGVAFDTDGVLWCNNSFSSKGIHALDRSGNFYDFNLAPLINNNEKLGDLIVGYNGFIYTNVIGRGLLVLNPNQTLETFSDDDLKLLTDDEGNGKLRSNDVLCMEEDIDGEIWVGTSQGLSVFYNPAAIFGSDGFDSEEIQIQQDNNTQILLATETVNAIKIDGSNRKWVATQNSGAYLLSDDGLNQIYHFTAENSPLLSNTVYDIGINQETGEVFFATENGVIGFFSTATIFDEEMSNVRVFPNPVRPDYEGNITIDGLAYNTSVKVTDLQGNILFETESEGGRAVWNGLREDGSRPATGVYLVFVSNPNGTADDVRQITFVR
ncbi:MAG: two-component regulator propeller domain-containing protein [Flavobacteriales bacterium]